MPCNPNSFAFGAQAIVDAGLTLAGVGWPVYYRVSNQTQAQENSEAADLGFIASGQSQQAGPTDIQIQPQPRVKNVNMRDISNSAGSVLELNQTSRLFVISHTFVASIMAKYSITDPEEVWDGFSQFLGLVYDGTLYAIKQYTHTEIGGQTVSWRLICNATKNQPS